MTFMGALPKDLAFALRRLGKTPTFTAICLLTLALGTGATNAVFTLVHQVMLTSLPVPKPFELYRLGDTDACCVNSGLQGSFSLFSYDLYRQLRDAAPEFSEIAAFQAHIIPMSILRRGDQAAEACNGQFVSGNYFTMFGVTGARGRMLVAADDRAGSAPTAVMSYRAWEQRFHSDVSIVGDALSIDGVATTIVGVAPRDLYVDMLRPDPPDFWVPIASEPLMEPQARLVDQPGSHWLYAIGRLQPAAPDRIRPAAVEQRLTLALQEWLRRVPDLSDTDRGRVSQEHIRLVPAGAGVANMRNEVAPSLRLLLAIAGAVLLVACANLANLLLARGFGRRAEVAVRAALGASRRRLAAEALVESLVLACAGGALGLAVAYSGARLIVSMAFRGARFIPVDASPSWPVLLFALGLAVITGITFGIVPALLGSLTDPIEALRGGTRITGDRSSFVRRALVSAQVALSLVLVACAGLLAQSLRNLERQNFGFQTAGRYVASLNAALGSRSPDQLGAIYRAVPERLGQIPGVRRVAFSLYSPMEGDNWSSGITVEGHATTERLGSSWDRVSPHYFETIGTPVVRGRAIDERDTPTSAPVAVVNERFVQKFFGDADPIGRRFGFAGSNGDGGRDYEIVGVVADAKYSDARRPPYITFFLPFLQHAPNLIEQMRSVEIRSNYVKSVELELDRPVSNLEAEVKKALADVDGGLTVRRIVSLDEQVARNFNSERLIATLTVGFGSMALLLACLGLYGVTAQFVAGRTREIGVRMAIGASRPRVVSTVLSGAIWQVAIGLVAGLAGALAAGRLLESQLYGVSGRDPRVIALSAISLAACAAVAAMIPAARAASIDPARAIRD